MIAAALVLASLATGDVDLVAAAIERYRTVEAYQVTLKSSYGDQSDIIRYSYKKPGFVRMDFVQPHKGAVLIYSPLTKKVRLWPFGSGFFSLTLSPENRLVLSPTGHRVDRSDIGVLLHNVKTLQRSGRTTVVGEEIVAGKKTTRLVVAGTATFVVDNVHRYELWLDHVTRLPLKAVSRDLRDDIIETVVMDDLNVNIKLGDELFNP